MLNFNEFKNAIMESALDEESTSILHEGLIESPWEVDLIGAYGVYCSGGGNGSARPKTYAAFYDDIESAREKAKRMNKILSPGEKKYYQLKYVVERIKKPGIKVNDWLQVVV